MGTNTDSAAAVQFQLHWAPNMLTGVLQRSNIKALLIAIYHAFPVCKSLLFKGEYKMCLEKELLLCKKKAGKVTSLQTADKHLVTPELPMGKVPPFNQP